MNKKIGIIGAMDIEIQAIAERMTVFESRTIAGMKFLSGKLGNTEIVLACSGIGKVFSAACTQAMILEFAPDYIMNIGVCGGLSKELSTGDIILGEKVVQYDMDTSAVGDPIGLISGINKIYFDCDEEMNSSMERIMAEKNVPYKKGVVATGDIFINDSNLVAKLRNNFNAIAGDMESASIGHVCYINNVPFGILRSMSDSGDENSDNDYKSSLEYAVKTTVDTICSLCE
ncbi:MAG: 5'-methylthioadenosine/adenosylhomocysteine nucleosidase [Clostridia bacterium]|nr:5'-methylthioadenosine/adenosylhomocysteine nucleosidase [Clostridia bacterium]